RDATAVMGAYRRATAPGAALRFVFEGASLTLVPGPGAGEIEVSVDEGAPRHFSLDGQPVQLVRGWQQKRHDVVLTAIAGEVSVDALTVQYPWRPSPWLILGTAGLLVAAIYVLMRTLRRR
ncbi:MAG: hypothetical protein IMY86_05350, partial [Chloroflexi bacterium]|nr:hypothetical protein [Chloroflexota bacterium]